MNMEIEQVKAEKRILYEVVAGSNAYGTNTPESDIDIRGIFWLPSSAYIRMNKPPEQAANAKNDIIYYTLHRFLELAQTANPNIIELLWMPEDCIRVKHELLNPLFRQRKDFLSKKAFVTHAAYAKAQIGKAKGQNKWINNPQPEAMPQREDFCHVILATDFPDGRTKYWNQFGLMPPKYGEPCVFGKPLKDGETKIDWILANLGMPFRPRKLSSFDERQRTFILENGRVAGLEHVPNTYRLYTYIKAEDKPKSGIFKNNALVTSSIPIEDEWTRFTGLLIYNENEFEAAKKDWQNYWTWKKERNEARWVSQERGEIDYDAKNMAHCMRLMLSAESILTKHEPIVRFEGAQLQMLKDIRAGKWQYAEIMKQVNELSARLDEANKTADLPEEMDVQIADKLMEEITWRCDVQRTAGVI